MVITRVYTNWSILIQLENGWNIINMEGGLKKYKNRGAFWPFCKLWSCEGTQKYSKDFSSTFYIKWDIYSNVKALGGWVILHRYFDIKRFRETWSEYPNYVQGHMTNDPLSSVPHITSIEDWFLCYVHLRYELYLFNEHYGNFGKTGSKIMSRDTKSDPKSSSHC